MMNAKVPPGGGSGLDCGSVFQDMTGMLLGQNLPRRLPRISSSRVLLATWLVFAIVFASAYRGNLTASLTLPKYPPRPETLQQLVESVKSQAHLDNRRYQHHNIAKWFTRQDGSELLYIGRETIMSGQSAWPLPHDAPYTAAIDRHLMAVVEAGLYEKWASDLLFEVQQESRKLQRHQQQPNGKREEKETHLSLSINHMQGTFMLLLLGLVLATLVFGGELITRDRL